MNCNGGKLKSSCTGNITGGTGVTAGAGVTGDAGVTDSTVAGQTLMFLFGEYLRFAGLHCPS